MAWVSTVDERYAGGYLSTPVNTYDAPSSIYSTNYRLAEGKWAYGNLAESFLRDDDVYSLGSLSSGYYTLDVDEWTWDYDNFTYGNLSKFSLLNSYGSVVETSYSRFNDIEFTVETSSTYYVEIEGPSYSEVQYRVKYEKTGDLSKTNSPAVFSNASYIGSLTVGSQVTTNIIYYDADGYSNVTQVSGLLTGWYTQDSSGYLEFLGGDYDDSIMLTEDMVGKTLLFNKGFIDALDNLETSGRYAIGLIESDEVVVDNDDGTSIPSNNDDQPIPTNSDDHGNSGSTSTSISIGQEISGSIENIADQDWFSVSMEAGETYLLEPVSSGSSAVTPFLAIYDPDERYETGSSSKASFQPETTGTYFLKVTDLRDLDTGAYSFTTTLVSSTNSDDHGNSGSTSTSISIGQEISGSIENIADQDWFSVSMEAGETYLLEPVSSGSSAVTPFLAIYDPDERYETGSSSKASFQPETTGTYFLKVTDLRDLDTGAYSFTTTLVSSSQNNAPTGNILITGVLLEKSILTINDNSISDPDGIGSFSYQWFRDNVEINGVTSSDYILTSADVGTSIYVVVSYIDGAGNLETISSSLTEKIQPANDDEVTTETTGSISATNMGSGTNVSLDFYVDTSIIPEDVTSFDMVLRFDSNGTEYVSADLGDFLGFPNASGDTITLSGISLSGVSSSDPLFTLNFTDLETSEDLTVSISDVVVNGTSLNGSTLLIGGPDTVDVATTVTSRSGASLSDVALSFDDRSDIITVNTNESGLSTASIRSGSDLTVTGSLDYAQSSKSVTSQDALDALRLSVGMDTQSGTSSAFDYIAADFNQDGKVSSQDALAILKYAVGLTTTEQAEWVFVDSDGDYSDISRTNTSYAEGITITDLTSATELSLTGILIGDLNDSFSELIA